MSEDKITPANSSDKKISCSFCGKSQEEVKKLIAGPNVYICNECVVLCKDILVEDDKIDTKQKFEIPKPSEIFNYLNDHIIGQDQAKKILSVSVYNHYKRVQNPSKDIEISKSNITVLIRGESGTGKELIAQSVHDNSIRSQQPFVAINVAAIPHDLLESELFGHEKGAFTGAQTQRIGRFEQAQGGTLFLDEIGDMHPELQTRLLRVLSSQEFYRVGGHRPIKSDVRIIAATNQSIEELIKTSKFREDLYHRLNVFKLELPPLRKRKEDIPALISYFLKASSIELNSEEKSIDKKTIEYLRDFDWPGNIRQLENICRYLTVMSSSAIITLEDLPDDILKNKKVDMDDETTDNWKIGLQEFIRNRVENDKEVIKETTSEVEKILIDESLRATNGVKLEAAKLLGWGRNTLARKVKEI